MEYMYFILFVACLILIVASAIKWALPFKKYSLIILISAILSLCISYVLDLAGSNSLVIDLSMVVCIFIIYAGILLFLFFRDPQRIPPDDPDVLVSPADGTIIYIKEVDSALLSSKKKDRILLYDELVNTKLSNIKLWQIGISLLFTDVHINRSPLSGKVSLLEHRPGKFLSLRDKEAVNVNERQTVIIENGKVTIGLIQIASRLVRRIESYVKLNEEIKIGQKIGMIKFGSQVDVFVPIELVPKLKVSVDQYLVAGETVLGNIRSKD
jgi:phosphatidylserine decarboxylase